MEAGSPDVVIAGGGVIGLAVAWRAAQADLSVTVVDPAPGTGASFVAAGMLAPVGEARWGEEDLLALNLRSASSWPGFAAELSAASDMPIGFRPCGSLLVGLDGGDRSVLEDLRRFQVHLGLPAEWLSGSQCREVEPLLAPGVRCGILAAGDHQVDPRQVLDALREACRRAGVTLVAGSVSGVVMAGERAAGVEVAGFGAITAGAVVVAAGCWSAGLAGLPDVARPAVRPLKGQILQLAGPASSPLLSRVLRCVVGGRSCYLLPREDGRLVVGSTSEEMGFDTRVTAGAVYELLRDAALVVPGIAELELREARAGLRPATSDNLPVVGQTPVGDLVLATGHGRNGILLCPVTADLVLAALRREPAEAWAAACSPARSGATVASP